MNFIIQHSCFPQSYYSGLKVIILDPELFLRIQSFLLWIQKYYSGSNVFTLDPKFITVDPKL